jgi:diguanylate cyclase (GGDEF)-like protein
MEKEIQNIDIYEGDVQQLKLSEDNPFTGITQSINVLLHQVHNYIEQIKQKNVEISDKNEQLTASEEELKAQVDEIDSQKNYINFLAEHDPLTNLPNRRMFNEKLAQSIENGKRGTVLLLDLDNFKAMNDTLGHLFGDKVLKHLSQKLEAMAGSDLFISRFGGDEFMLLYEMNENNEDIMDLIKRLFAAINEKFQIDQIEVKIEFSIGVSMFPKDSMDMNELIKYADMALYDVKGSSKNGYSFYNNVMAEQLIFRQSVKNILRDAIDNDGFKVLYQPQVAIPNGEVIGYEALLRLKKSGISPADFIAIAEEDGMIIEIGRIVTELVLKQMYDWKEKGLVLKPVSINFSTIQIQDHEYKEFLLEKLEKYEIDPKLIVIEITESIFLENKETTIVFLNELRSYGIKIAVDDFGTGYSSLSYLTFLPIDAIKLDRTLNIKFLELENISVMDSLISLAHSLNLKVVAEGIEEKEQVKRLIVGKCDVIQGFYFCGPLEAEDVEINYNRIYN